MSYDQYGNRRRKGTVWFDKDKEGVSRLFGSGVVTTDEDCSNCHKMFRMRVNFDVNGNHVMVCPHCGHKHCRTIRDGKVTGDRWDTRNADEDVPPDGSMWSDTTIGAQTSVAFQHIRERWLGRGS